MNCGGGRRSTGWPRRASAAGRGSLWWWRAFSRASSPHTKCLTTEVTEEHRGKPGFPLCSSVPPVVKGFRMDIRKVGVLGCGLMGSGIAQVCATAGFDVTVLEVEQKYLDKGFAGIEKSLAKFAERGPEKGGITPQQKDEIRARLKGTTTKAELADCDIVIEAIIENVEEKKNMYASLDGILKKDAIFASNTSSISVTELLTATKRPERFVGLHFFNPVPLM